MTTCRSFRVYKSELSIKVSKSTIGPRNQAVNRTEKAPQKCSDFFRTVILKNSRTLKICSDPQRKIDWNCAQVLLLKLRQKNHSQKESRKIKGNLSVFIIEYQINSPTILKRFYFTCQFLLGGKVSPLQRRQIDSSWGDCRVSNVGEGPCEVLIYNVRCGKTILRQHFNLPVRTWRQQIKTVVKSETNSLQIICINE